MTRRLFLPPESMVGGVARIEGPNHHHLVNVLRARTGAKLLLLDNKGRCYSAVLDEIDRKIALASIVCETEPNPEPIVHITVAQSIGKGERFEEAVQHGTEAGASAFIPLVTERTVVKLDARDKGTRRERWKLVAKGAAEQANRCLIPEIRSVSHLRDLIALFGDYHGVFVLHPSGESFNEALAAQRSLFQTRLLLVAGPEGGFSQDEIDAVRLAGAGVLSLGPHVLRTETAALVALSRILFAAELRLRQSGGCKDDVENG